MSGPPDGYVETAWGYHPEEECVNYGLISAWAKKFGIPESTLRRRLKDTPFVEATMHNSRRIARGYSEEDVRRLCADLIPPQ
jgi:hypothetical protein